MSMVRERAIRQYVTHHKRRKVIELEHKAATTCQAAIRSFFARRYTDSIVNSQIREDKRGGSAAAVESHLGQANERNTYVHMMCNES